MTITLRRTLALIFAGLFIVIALTSIAYSRGYRFDVKNRQVRLTGVIMLAGAPSKVQVFVDTGKPKNVSLPTTLRGLLPSTHAVTVSAPGFTSQTLTLNVRSGQTTFATDIQLFKENPFTTIRTGVPSTAVLAPDGTAVAWLDENALIIANPAQTKKLTLVAEVERITWSANSEDIVLLDASNATVGIASKAGALRGAGYIVSTKERDEVLRLLRGRMSYTQAQRIPNSAAWLLVDESSAWVLQPDGELTLATRWGNAIINTLHLGREIVATVRQSEILARNIVNDQTAFYEIPNISQAAAGEQAGELNILIADGDLLLWQRGNLFAS